MLDSSFVTQPVLAALIVFTGYPILNIFYNIFFHPLAKIPGPWTWSCSRLPFVAALIKGTIVQDLERLHRTYGPVVRVAPDEVSFAKPEAYNDILLVRQDQEQFLKSPVWWGKQPGQDVSIVNAINPEMHAQIRRTIMGGFTTRALKAQEPIVQRYVNLLVDRLKENMSKEVHGKEAVVDIAPWFQFVTFDIFGDLGFGESFNCLEQAKYHAWIELLFNSIKASVFVASARYYPLIDSLLMKLIPPSLKKMQNDHYQHIVDKVQRRLNWELERPDLMSHVINQGDGKKRLPLGMISSTFSLMAIAGSETTATLLTGTMNLLLAQPTRLAILVEELRASFSSTEEMTLDALKSLPYLNAVLKEGLRLCPPVPWVLPRKVPVGGGTVCGVGLPEGTSVTIQAWTINRDPTYFHSAESFIPERWLPEASSNPKSPYFNDQRQALQPFGVGPRNCIGQQLAWAEMRLILSKLLWNFEFKAIEGKTLNWEELKTFVVVEKCPMEVTIKLRAT